MKRPCAQPEAAKLTHHDRALEASPLFQPAWRIAHRVARGETTCRAVLERQLEQIERRNPAVNAIVALDAVSARAQADRMDQALRGGAPPGPLAGVPMTVKDTLDVAGLASTWGAVGLKGNVAARNARAVDLWAGAGAILLGKTNIPTFSQGWQTSNALFGVTNNPWDLARTPGGSTGGGAAALAAGLTAIDIGTDIGGSLRNPAHYCGVYSHRPTYGLVDLSGNEFPGSGVLPDLATIGPLARSAADLEMLLNLLAAPNEEDSVAWSLRLPGASKSHWREFRVSVVLQAPTSRVDDKVRSALETFGEWLRAQGAQVEFDVFPNFDLADQTSLFWALAAATTAGAWPEKEFRAAIAASAEPDAADPKAQTHARNVTMRHRDWLDLDQRRRFLRREWAGFFRRFDFLLCPAAATVAPPHDPVTDDRQRFVRVDGESVSAIEQYFWASLATCAGLPATTAPLALGREGLPTGVQIVGPRYADLACIGFAKLLERDYRGFQPPPGFGES